MAFYAETDIEVDDGGQIQVEDGDLKIANPRRSALQAVHWMVLTNRGEAVGGEKVANLIAYFGRMNIPSIHRSMEESIRRANLSARVVSPSDLGVQVTPIGINDALVKVQIRGSFLDDEDSADYWPILYYDYPFGNGLPVKIDLDESS